MGLYLSVCDQSGDELEGVEVGFYEDFGVFRDAVLAAIEESNSDWSCPTLMNHSDCDGEWTSREAGQLLTELERIDQLLRQYPPVELSSGWKKEVARACGICPQVLYDCFFDVNGEPLVEGLQGLAQISVESGQPITFQ